MFPFNDVRSITIANEDIWLINISSIIYIYYTPPHIFVKRFFIKSPFCPIFSYLYHTVNNTNNLLSNSNNIIYKYLTKKGIKK